LLLNGPIKIPISSVSTEYSRKEQVTKQNKTKQDAPRKGRNLTSGGLLPYSLPHDNASSRPSPSSATCSSIKAVSGAGTALHHQLSLAPLQPPQSYRVCLSVTKPQTIDSGRRPSFQIQQASAVLEIPLPPPRGEATHHHHHHHHLANTELGHLLGRSGITHR
jgi:hypothetical protein